MSMSYLSYSTITHNNVPSILDIYLTLYLQIIYAQSM